MNRHQVAPNGVDEMAHDNSKTSYQKIRLREENDKLAKILRPYASFLVRFPSVVLVITFFVVLFSVLLGVIGALGAKNLPDFSEPVKGFESRGTVLSARIKSYENLEKEEISDGNLLNYNVTAASAKLQQSSSRKRRDSLDVNNDGLLRRNRRQVPNYIDVSSVRYISEYSKFILVYKHEDDDNLLTYQNLKSICEIYETKIKTFPGYIPGNNVHHIPNYIARYYGNNSCRDITQDNVNEFVDIMKICATFYRSGVLKKCAEDHSKCAGTISESRCYLPNNNLFKMAALLYNIYYYMVEKAYFDDTNNLKITASFTEPGGYDEESFYKPIYKDLLLDLDQTKIDNVKIVAYELGDLKFNLFQTEIILQSLWIIGAIVCVILFIWFYSGSIFIGLMTLCCIVFALIISYFVYGRIFDMDFFPFLNMVTLIFIVGIGADDAFVYTGIWEEAKQVYPITDKSQHEEYLIKWTIHSLRHALLAMLVTSLTTAAAFYANISSSITSVKCFGLYAGTSIIVNYLLMVFFFPIVVILHEKYLASCMHWCCPATCKSRPMLNDEYTDEQSKVQLIQSKLDEFSQKLFEDLLPSILFKGRYVFIVVLLALGIAGAVITFGSPGLNLPSSKDFQMFVSSNTLEHYELTYKKLFAFTSQGEGDRYISFIFGIKDVDNGYYFNPDSKGNLEINSGTLKIGNNQEWLLEFCQNLRNASFYVGSTSCNFYIQLYTLLIGPCTTSDKTCCEKTLPLPEKDFLQCYYNAVINFNPRKSIESHPIFNRAHDLQALMIPVQTNLPYTADNKENEKTFDTLENWFNGQIAKSKDRSFSSGWWFGYDFEFYDLQVSLFKGTKESLGIALAVAFTVILLTTFNIFLSFYSILAIFFIISVTIGVLVLRGWDLNIMESVIFSVAAGLAADFTLHYSVAYQSSLSKGNRVERTKDGLSHIGSAVLMGAFTTFIAGLVMVPAQVLAYFQMAQFLMLTMFVSWIYSTFFFLPLCMVIGPTHNFGQLTCGKLQRARQSIRHSVHRGGDSQSSVSMQKFDDGNIQLEHDIAT